jgi:hypothetical protein
MSQNIAHRVEKLPRKCGFAVNAYKRDLTTGQVDCISFAGAIITIINKHVL